MSSIGLTSQLWWYDWLYHSSWYNDQVPDCESSKTAQLFDPAVSLIWPSHFWRWSRLGSYMSMLLGIILIEYIRMYSSSSFPGNSFIHRLSGSLNITASLLNTSLTFYTTTWESAAILEIGTYHLPFGWRSLMSPLALWYLAFALFASAAQAHIWRV